MYQFNLQAVHEASDYGALGPIYDRKKEEKIAIAPPFRGLVSLSSCIRLDAFFSVACIRPGHCPGGGEGPKTARKAPSAGKSVCISVTILTCFSDGQTYALVAMGRTDHDRWSIVSSMAVIGAQRSPSW